MDEYADMVEYAEIRAHLEHMAHICLWMDYFELWDEAEARGETYVTDNFIDAINEASRRHERWRRRQGAIISGFSAPRKYWKDNHDDYEDEMPYLGAPIYGEAVVCDSCGDVVNMDELDADGYCRGCGGVNL